VTPPMLHLADNQGNILRGYRSLHHARLLLFCVLSAESGKRCIDSLLPLITDADAGRDLRVATNIAFTFAGLRALGLPTSSLASFPAAFQDGMKVRSAMLGDSDDAAVARWDMPWRAHSAHFMITVHAMSRVELETRSRKILQLLRNEVAELHPHQDAEAIFGESTPSRIEHFGFADGLSSPDITDVPSDSPRLRVGNPDGHGGFRPVALGEFILGYRDEGGEIGVMPVPHALARNGSYLVVRKLHQHVARFRQFLEDQAAVLRRVIPGADAGYLAAKMVGRWPDGRSLTSVMAGTVGNDFGYADDPEGALCPLGAHVRRANPRDSLGFGGKLVNRHRLIRRGITYGPPLPPSSPDDGVPRGLMFLAFNADIERQFEFVQRQWINDGDKFRQGNDRDPLVGSHVDTGRMVVPGDVRDGRPPFFCGNIPRFVTTRGGDYFFSPSLTGLRLIASGQVRTT
jgi:Dyp-type peroxidase family